MNSQPESSTVAQPVPPVDAIPPPGNITQTSQKAYKARIEAMRLYSARKRSRDPEEPVWVSVLDAVEDLTTRTDLSAAGVMSYRSAMLWYLRDLQDQSELNRKAYGLLLTLTHRNDTPQTGRPRKKSITEKDYEDLISELAAMASSSVWAQRVQFWVHATLASGARPVEWLDAAFEDDAKTRLAIATAKEHVDPPRFLAPGPSAGASDDDTAHHELDADHMDDQGEGEGAEVHEPFRVTGEKRVIPIAHGMDRLATESHLASFNHFVRPELSPSERLDRFRKYHDQCRWVLRNACQRLWKGKKNYTLYTFRSQFQANQRAVLGAEGALALMGHSSITSTSSAHYGKASQAFARFKGERVSGRVQAETNMDTPPDIESGLETTHAT